MDRRLTSIAVAIALLAACAGVATAQGERMSNRATGTFEVTMTPQGEPDAALGAKLGRMSLSKTFAGDLEGTSRGEMLTAVTDTKGSAGYVAIERVSGTLDGREGTFVLQHNGVMSAGGQELSIVVVPDSGTGALTGIAGTFELEMVDGQHRYTLAYSLPA